MKNIFNFPVLSWFFTILFIIKLILKAKDLVLIMETFTAVYKTLFEMLGDIWYNGSPTKFGCHHIFAPAVFLGCEMWVLIDLEDHIDLSGKNSSIMWHESESGWMWKQNDLIFYASYLLCINCVLMSLMLLFVTCFICLFSSRGSLTKKLWDTHLKSEFLIWKIVKSLNLFASRPRRARCFARKGPHSFLSMERESAPQAKNINKIHVKMCKKW